MTSILSLAKLLKPWIYLLKKITKAIEVEMEHDNVQVEVHG